MADIYTDSAQSVAHGIVELIGHGYSDEGTIAWAIERHVKDSTTQLRAEVDKLTTALDDANRRAAEAEAKLAPSPCGHRNADLVVVPTGDPEMWDNKEICLACRQREAIAAAERERCAIRVELADSWMKQPDNAQELADQIRSLSPTLTLDEMLAKARLEEAEWWEHLAEEHHHEVTNNPEYYKETCIYCKRLAELRAKAKEVHRGPA